MNGFIRAVARISSFGEKYCISPKEIIITTARIKTFTICFKLYQADIFFKNNVCNIKKNTDLSNILVHETVPIHLQNKTKANKLQNRTKSSSKDMICLEY